MAFYNLFVLSCFKQKHFMKTTTLYHVLKGKRTSSILSYAYFYDVLPFFGLLPKLDEKKYKAIIDNLRNEQLLIEKDGYANLTASGIELLSQVEMPEKEAINQLKFYRWDMSFFDSLLFASQVISEKAHKNIDYLPLTTNFYKQQQLKKWLSTKESDLAVHFYEEWHRLIENLTISEQMLILPQLVGHGVRGMTLNQIAKKEKIDSFFAFLSFKNTWHKILKVIIDERNSYPLFNSLLQLELSSFKSDTRKLTLDLFLKRHSIDEIATIRKLKVGTITDHLIDEFLVTKNSCYMPSFSEDTILGFDKLLKLNPNFVQWTYQDALLICPNIPFYEFRFFQFHLKEKELLHG